MSPEEAESGQQKDGAAGAAAPLRGLLGSLDSQSQALAVLSRKKFEKWSRSRADTPRKQDRLAQDLQRLAKSCGALVATFDEAVESADALSRRRRELSADSIAVVAIVEKLRRLQFRELAVQLRRLFTTQSDQCRQPLDSATAQELLTQFLNVLPAVEIVASQVTTVLKQLDEVVPPNEPMSVGHNQPLLSGVNQLRDSLAGFVDDASKQLVDSLSPRPGVQGTEGVKRAAAALQDYREAVTIVGFHLERYGSCIRGGTEDNVHASEYWTALRRLRVHEQTVGGMLKVLDEVYHSVFQIPVKAPAVAESLADIFAQLRVENHDLSDLLNECESSGAGATTETAVPSDLPSWAELTPEQRMCVCVFFESDIPLSRYALQDCIARTTLGAVHVDTVRNWVLSLKEMGICQIHQPDRKRGERRDGYSLATAARDKYASQVIKPGSK